MRRELNSFKRLNQSYQELYKANCHELILWHSRLSQLLVLVLCELCMEDKNEAYREGTPEKKLFVGNHVIVMDCVILTHFRR